VGTLQQHFAFSELLNDTLLQQHGALHILGSLTTEF
jgi:hypothetical protein